MAKKFHLPIEAAIRTRAYHIYLERGCKHGYEIDDWLQAEYELIQLPLDKVAKLEAIAAEKEKIKNLRLVALAQAFLTLKKRASKPLQPLWNRPTVSKTGGMESAA